MAKNKTINRETVVEQLKGPMRSADLVKVRSMFSGYYFALEYHTCSVEKYTMSSALPS